MKIRLEGFKRLLVESALIVFSVLFALFINRYAENQKIQRQKQVALERIEQEMKSNREVIDSAIQIHQGALLRLQKAAVSESDSLRTYLADRGYFDPDVFGLLLNNGSFLPEIPKSTSWNAAMTIGIVAEFDYEVVNVLTEVYDFQRFITEETLTSILSVFYAPIAEEEIRTINTLSVQISELINLEQTTVSAIDKALKVIHPSDTTQVEP